MAWFNYAIARRAATLLFLATAAALKVPHAPTAQPRRNAAAPLLKRVASAAVAFSALSAPLVALPEAALAAKPSDAATSAGSRVNKDPESLLRNGLPIGGAIGSATKKAEARKVQQAVEAIKDDLRAKRIRAAGSDVVKAQTLLGDGSKIAAGAPGPVKDEVEALLGELKAALDPIAAILADTGAAGSPQERDSLDKAFAAQATAADLVSKVEARLVPAGLKYANAPPEFKNVPRLDGRARVEWTMVKKDKGGTFAVDGILYKEAKMEMILDGYTTPLTSGNFLDLVSKGFYNGMAIQRADGFVVQTGDPDGPDGPLIGYGQDGDPKKEPRRVPLELFVDGDKAPTYGETTEDGQRGSAQTVLPFQAYGAMGMARDEYEADSASSQFFFLLFDSDLTPAGKNLLDGRYSCFGYTIAGSDFLGAVEEGDIIKSVKILKAPPPFGDYTGLDP